MKSIPISFADLLTTIYVMVDDWNQETYPQPLKKRAGVAAVFSDSEVMTLMLAHDYLPYPGETQFLGAYPRKLPESVSQAAGSIAV